MKNGLQVPYAYMKPNLTPSIAEFAQKGKDYLCPICKKDVILRQGDIRVPHFAHKKETGCSGEGILHKTAKQMICTTFKNDGNMISPRHNPHIPCDVCFVRTCEKCGSRGASNHLIDGTFDVDCVTPFGFTDVESEFNVGNVRLDVAIVAAEHDASDVKIPLLGIEIRDKNKVSTEKWDSFHEWEFPCIEVTAVSVIEYWRKTLKADLPSFRVLYLEPVKHNFNLESISKKLKRYDCYKCDPQKFTT